MTMKTVLATFALALVLAACAEQPQPDAVPAVQDGAATPAPRKQDPSVLSPVAAEGAVAAVAAEVRPDAPEGGACALDAVNGKPRMPAMSLASGGALLFGGWAATDDLTPPREAALLFRGESRWFAAPLSTGSARPDVARVKKSEALATAGFNLKVSTAGMPAGSYRIGVVVDPASETWCDLNVDLTLR